MRSNLSIAIQVSISSSDTSEPTIDNIRITDDLGERITDDNQTRITDGI